jgi:hypothetical protein
MNTPFSTPSLPARQAARATAVRPAWAAMAAAAALFQATAAPAANIVWVTDANDPATGFFPPGPNYTDSGFVNLLLNAGHNVILYNPPASQNTLLTAAEIDALNTNDLIILGRCVGSGIFQPGQGNQWNTAITKPIIGMSPYHVRADASRMGWLAGNTADALDDTPTPLKATINGDPAHDAVVEYLFAGVIMSGTNTALPYDEALDRNTSHIAGAPVAGAAAYATVNYVQQNNTTDPPTMNFGNAIVGLPAGTTVRNGTEALAGYRMFFAGGSRETTPAAFPNIIQNYAGRENLTAAGEDVFLRAVQVAINNGAAPATDPSAPPSIVTQPQDVTAGQADSATFTISVAGAAPRTVQWQRDTGDGVTFTNIPDASSPFRNSQLSLPVVGTGDNNAKFRVEVSNANGALTSDIVTLTVTPDNAPPVPLSAASLDGTSIMVCFDEPLNPAPEFNPSLDPINYTLTDSGGAVVIAVSPLPGGRSVLLGLSGPVSPNYTLLITYVEDRVGNAIPDPGVMLAGAHYGFTTADVGALNPSGTNYACDAARFVVGGGGLDIQATAEQMRLAYKTVSGDFDARVRVDSLTGTFDHLEATAKAMLCARASTDAAAPSVNAFVTPSYPGDGTYWATARTSSGAATSSNVVAVPYGLNAIPVTYPAWLRIVRTGDSFATFRSSNGTDWTPLGSINVAMGPDALVGVGAVSHRNGRLAFGTFSQFSISQRPSSPTLTGLTYSGGSFSASFQTQSGITYTVEYKDDFNTALWTTLTTVDGDGSVKSFTDPGASGPQRFYRLIVP